MSQFQTNLKIRRKELGLSQGALAEKCGVEQWDVSYWERGLKKPKNEELVKLEKVLGSGVFGKKTVVLDNNVIIKKREFNKEAFKFARVKMGLTQLETSKLLGVSPSNVGSWECGYWIPSEAVIEVIKAKMGKWMDSYELNKVNYNTNTVVVNPPIEEKVVEIEENPVSLSEMYQNATATKREEELLLEIEGYKKQILDLQVVHHDTMPIIDQPYLVVNNPRIPQIFLANALEECFFGIMNQHGVKGYIAEMIRGGGEVITVGIPIEEKYRTKLSVVEKLVSEGKIRVYMFKTFKGLAAWMEA